MKKTLDKKVAILVWSSNIWSFAEGLLGPLFAVFAQQIGGNVLDIAWAWGAYLIVTGVFVIVIGHFSDRVSKLGLLFAGHSLTAALTFGYIFIHTPLQLVFIQVVLGFAHALTIPAWLALMAQYSAGSKEGSQWGWADGGAKIAGGIAAVFGGMIVAQTSFATLFIIMGILQIVSALYISRLFYTERY